MSAEALKFVHHDSKIIKFREPRIAIPISTESKCSIELSNGQIVSCNLVNISEFGSRVDIANPGWFPRIGDKIKLAVTIENEAIYNSTGTITNLLSSDIAISCGIALDEPIDLRRLNAAVQMDDSSASLKSAYSNIELKKRVQDKFKLLSADLHTLIQELRKRLLEEEAKIKAAQVDKQARLMMEEHAVNVALALYSKHFQEIFSSFTEIVDGMTPDDRALHKHYFRVNFHPLLLNADFVKRGFQKPLGYAGDYGLMVMLYEKSEVEGDLFTKFFHRYSCNSPAALANKNRVDFLAAKFLRIAEQSRSLDEFKITSVACGPAEELSRFLTQIPQGFDRAIKLVCIDHEPKALEHAQSKLKNIAAKKKQVSLSFLAEDAVLGVIRNKIFTKEIAGSSIISCAGLFDYLSDRVSTKLIESLYELVQPGGYLIIGNVSDSNPDAFVMDFLMEWNLLLRSSADLVRLVPESIKSTPNVKIEVLSESLGLNLFLIIKKPQ